MSRGQSFWKVINARLDEDLHVLDASVCPTRLMVESLTRQEPGVVVVIRRPHTKP